MLSNILSVAATAALISVSVADSTPHAAGAQGSVMGPVAFLWPADRPWSADADNTAPCGSSSGVGARTQFPLDNGAVSLSIAEEAYQVAFRIAYNNDPLTASAFSEQIVHTVEEVDPGHQCYRVPSTPMNITSGQNATIQLEYWSSYQEGSRQSFYACADVTLVDASAFVGSIPCFNVTSTDFEPPVSATKEHGLSTRAKAGIAVGSIVGGLGLLGAIAFVLFRKRSKAKRDLEATNQFSVVEKQRAASIASGETQVAA
ncbi:hypothetical protein HYALB_00009174 [Hymenoscyphus albidus]|uniref:Copper acquisition factor BIM1-like domain-containing protein n=1 Tax=Hymenoscyphus albidus TaxID=595503 RepID=A0A9N9LXZ2_9HELO|nr:hypothetical protein HYALB_00009174 [Hymenoscyphus albidus]